VIIVDTSIWVDHFRRPAKALQLLIAEGGIGLHPYVFGELALGGFPVKGAAFDEMMALARPPVASSAEALAFITWAELSGKGIGYVDTHLLISARLLGTATVLTKDKCLQAQAERLAVAYTA
jgi:predicted nucleic acid-binding protein